MFLHRMHNGSSVRRICAVVTVFYILLWMYWRSPRAVIQYPVSNKFIVPDGHTVSNMISSSDLDDSMFYRFFGDEKVRSCSDVSKFMADLAIFFTFAVHSSTLPSLTSDRNGLYSRQCGDAGTVVKRVFDTEYGRCTWEELFNGSLRTAKSKFEMWCNFAALQQPAPLDHRAYEFVRVDYWFTEVVYKRCDQTIVKRFERGWVPLLNEICRNRTAVRSR